MKLHHYSYRNHIIRVYNSVFRPRKKYQRFLNILGNSVVISFCLQFYQLSALMIHHSRSAQIRVSAAHKKKLVRFRPIKLQDTRKTDQSKLWTANHHFSPIHYLSLLISNLNIYNLGLYERSISCFLLEFQYCQ